LRQYFSEDSINGYANFLRDSGISVVKDAMIAINAGGVHALHDPTEGGIATGLHELAEAAGVGLEIFEEQLPYLPETMALCKHFNLDPLGIIASGALLMAADPQSSPQIIEALQQAGIKATVIGTVQPEEKGRWLNGETGTRPLPTFPRDEITRLFE